MTHFNPEPHFWNTQVINRVDGKTTFDIRGKWLNWMSSGGWRKIVADVKSDRTITELPYDVRFPLTAQGECDILANGRFSMKRHIDEKNGDNSEPDFDMQVQALAESNVTGHQDPDHPERWVYPGAWPGTTLRYGIWWGRSPRIEKVLEIDPTQVNGNLRYKFLVKMGADNQYFTGPKTGARRPLWTGNLRAVPTNTQAEGIFIAKGNSEHRGVTLKAAVAWYFEAGVEVRVPITLRSRETAPGVVEITKLIPASVVLAARQAGSMLWTDATFYPDPSPETNTADGNCQRVSANSLWYILRNSPGTFGQDNLASYGQWMTDSGTTSGRWDRINRTGFSFDTSSLSGEVESASFEQFNDGFSTNQLGFDHTIYWFNPASNTAVVAADFTLGRFGTTAWSDDQYTVTEIASGNSQAWAFNATGLLGIEDGITSLAIRSVKDNSLVSPPWSSNKRDSYTPYFAEQSGTANDPKLEVTTAAAIARLKNTRFLLNFARL